MGKQLYLSSVSTLWYHTTQLGDRLIEPDDTNYGTYSALRLMAPLRRADCFRLLVVSISDFDFGLSFGLSVRKSCRMPKDDFV